MDQIKAPEIKPEVNREEERKGGGFFFSLLSKLGGGLGQAGVEGLGSGGAGLAGGLLATKAGIIALALIGASLAGGLGVVGYKAFGPGSDQGGRYSSLFEARPQSGGGASGVAADGSSQSLDMLVKANSNQAGPEAGAAPAAGAVTEGAGAGAGAGVASADPAAPAVPVPAANNDNAPAQGAAAVLKGDRKIGELSKISLSGAGSGSSAASIAFGGPAALGALPPSAKGAGLSAFPAGKARAAGGGRSGMRGVGASASALKQLGLVRGDQRGAASSQQAGRTYDGPSGGFGGADGGFGVGSGPGYGAADRAPSLNPTYGNMERFPPVPPEKGKDVTPWKAAIETATLLVVAATALIFLAGKVSKMQLPHARALAAVMAAAALAMGLAVIALGAMIGGGAYGQTLQGGILTLSGGFITTAAVMAMAGLRGVKPGADKMAPGMSIDKLAKIMGAGALAAAAAAYMATPKSFPSAKFENGRPPDWDHAYQGASHPNG